MGRMFAPRFPGLLVLPLLAGGGGGRPARLDREVIVYAATSLRDALTGLAAACERATGARLVFNFGASSDLARQILAARKADIFFSADEAWLDHLASAGMVEAGTRRTVLSNRLVVVVPAGSTGGPEGPASAEDLAGPWVKRLSIGEPFQVPAGRYAMAWLRSAGVWDRLADRVAPAIDARAALAAVESGAASAGIVYRTDAALSRKVRVLHEVAGPDAPRIAYPLAVLAPRPHDSGPAEVADWLSGLEARAAFHRAGFIDPGSSR